MSVRWTFAFRSCIAFDSGAVAFGALPFICSCNLLLITDINFFIQQGAIDKPVTIRDRPILLPTIYGVIPGPIFRPVFGCAGLLYLSPILKSAIGGRCLDGAVLGGRR